MKGAANNITGFFMKVKAIIRRPKVRKRAVLKVFLM
jgi:hypothetical protein